MATIRVNKTKGFTVMSNYHLRDKNLSLKAKGLLSMMLALPDEWHYTVRGLAGLCKEGVDSVSSGIRELDKCGYVRRHQPMSNGKFQEIEYIIYETPQKKEEDSTEPAQEKNTSAKSSSAVSKKTTSTTCDLHPVNTDFPDTEHTDTNSTGADFTDTDFSYTESPCTENPYTVNADTEDSYAVSSDTAFPWTNDTDTEMPDTLLNTKGASTERLNTDENNHPSINPRNSASVHIPDRMDEMDPSFDAKQAARDYQEYHALVAENIDLESLCIRNPHETKKINGIVDLMTEAICARTPYLRIGGQDYPQEIVKSRLLKLNYSHIEYVLNCLSRNTTKIHNIRAYLLATLFNAPSTIDAYYENWVHSDFPDLARK